MIQQTQSDIQSFLNLKRIALVGASRDRKHISRQLMNTLAQHGLEILPVHPEADSLDGRPCYADLASIVPKPEAALVMLKPDRFREIVDQCITAGIDKVWLYGVSGPKSVDTDLQQHCLVNGLELIAGYCPFMFLENAGGIHKFHGFLWKLSGRYPKP